MNTASSTIIQRLWNYCNILRDDGMSYGDPPPACPWCSSKGLPQIRKRDLGCLPSFWYRICPYGMLREGRSPAGRWGFAFEGRL
jgi:hypothetical protein